MKRDKTKYRCYCSVFLPSFYFVEKDLFSTTEEIEKRGRGKGKENPIANINFCIFYFLHRSNQK